MYKKTNNKNIKQFLRFTAIFITLIIMFEFAVMTPIQAISFQFVSSDNASGIESGMKSDMKSDMRNSLISNAFVKKPLSILAVESTLESTDIDPSEDEYEEYREIPLPVIIDTIDSDENTLPLSDDNPASSMEGLKSSSENYITTDIPEDGLILQIMKPGGGSDGSGGSGSGTTAAPASGALVTVHHAYYSDDEERMVYEEIWRGPADENGMVIIPGTEATYGNDFFVTARGFASETNQFDTNFIYFSTVRAPAKAIIDDSNASEVKISATDLEGQPLTGAKVIIELLESNVPSFKDPNGVPYFFSERMYGNTPLLDELGNTSIVLTHGRYNIRIVSQEDVSQGKVSRYYLFEYGVEITSDTKKIEFHPTDETVAILEFVPDADATDADVVDADLTLYTAGSSEYGINMVKPDEIVIITPGTYSAWTQVTYRETESPESTTGTDWFWNFGNRELALSAGEYKQYRVGGDLNAEIYIDEFYNNKFYPGDLAYFLLHFSDEFGNDISGVGKMSYEKQGDEIVYGDYISAAPELRIIDSNDVNIYDIGDASMDYAYWVIPNDATGRFTANVRFDAEPFEPVESNSVEFEVVPGSYYHLQVNVLDRTGNPMTGARVIPVELKASSASYIMQYAQSTNSEGKVSLYLDTYDNYREYTHGLIIYGNSPDPANPLYPPEPLFMYVPINIEELPVDMTIDTSDTLKYPMKRVQLVSADENGDELSVPHYNAIYTKNQDGLTVGAIFDITNDGEQVLWLPYGEYEYQTFVNNTVWDDDWENKPLYFMTREIIIDEQTHDAQVIKLGGDSLATLSLTEPQADKTTPIQALALFGKEGSLSPVFYPSKYDKNESSGALLKRLYITPGTYKVHGVFTSYEKEVSGNWNFWIEKMFTLDDGENIEWSPGSIFNAEITTPNISVGVNETVEFINKIEDNLGNRLVAAANNFYFPGWENASISGDGAFGIMSHYEIAPFITIYDNDEQEIFRYKNDAGNYSILEKWKQWDINQHWNIDDGAVRSLSKESTYFKGSYDVPGSIQLGEYKALLQLGMGPFSLKEAQTSFYVTGGLGAPVLEQPVSITNEQIVTISGSASPGADIIIYYKLNDGAKTQAANVKATQAGTFKAEIGLSAEGEYKITAVAIADDITSMESVPVTITVDRTPPASPGNLKGESPDASTIKLSWEAPEGEDLGSITYEIKRDGSVISEGISGGISLTYTDEGLSEDTEYSYQVFAIDGAGNISEQAETTVKTIKGPDRIPPEAPKNVQATLDDELNVIITWDASMDNVATTGYIIYRSIDGSDFDEVGRVLVSEGLDDLKFEDKNLYNSITYRYIIKAFDDNNNISEPSIPVEIITPSLAISSLRCDVAKDKYGYINTGSELLFTVHGDKNRFAYIDLVYECWNDENGNPMDDPVELAATLKIEEIRDSSGKGTGEYRYAYTIVPGTTAIKSAKLRFTNDAPLPYTRTISVDIVSLPVNVSGTLEFSIAVDPQTTDYVLNMLKGGRISVWSDTMSFGKTANIGEDLSGTKTFAIQGLLPGNDYKLNIYNSLGESIYSIDQIELQKGKINKNQCSTTEIKEPARLFVRVVEDADEGQKPVEGVRVSVINASDNSIKASYLSNKNGWVCYYNDGRREAAIIDKENVLNNIILQVSFGSNINEYYLGVPPVRLTLQPGETEKTIILKKMKSSTLKGTVTLPGDLPGKNIQIIANQFIRGKYLTKTTETDEEGRYSIELYPGSVDISTSSWRLPSNQSYYGNTTIEDGKENIFDIKIQMVNGYIELDTYVQMAGEDKKTFDMSSSWRIGAHIPLTVTRKKSGYSNYLSPGEWESGITIYNADPYETFAISLDGSQAGMRAVTTEVTLDDDYYAHAEIVLKEEGKLKVSVKDHDGNSQTGSLRTMYVYDMNIPGTKLVEDYDFKTDATELHLPEGKYTAIFHWGYKYSHGTMKAIIGTLQGLENFLSLKNVEYVKMENFDITFNKITDLGLIITPIGQDSDEKGAFGKHTDTWLKSNKSKASPGSIITYSASFHLPEDFDQSEIIEPVMKLDIANGTTLLPQSIQIRTDNNFIPSYEIENDYIDINLFDTAGTDKSLCSRSGTVTWQVCVKNSADTPVARVAAEMVYILENQNTGRQKSVTELIGFTDVDMPFISITAPKVASERKITVSGYGPQDSTLNIYDGGLLIAKTVVSRYGTWMKEIELPEGRDPSVHYIYARLAENESMYNWARLTYDTNYPTIKRVTMSQPNGQVASYNPKESIATFPYVYVPNHPVNFAIEFDNIERVDKESVKINCSNGKTLRGYYDYIDGVFKASGNITGTGENYFPGEISVSYKPNPIEWSVPSELPDEDDIRKSLPEFLRNAEITISGEHENPEDYIQDDGSYLSPEVTVRSKTDEGKDIESVGQFRIEYLEEFPDISSQESVNVLEVAEGVNFYNYGYEISQDENGDTVIEGTVIMPVEALLHEENQAQNVPVLKRMLAAADVQDVPALAPMAMSIQAASGVGKVVKVGWKIIEKGEPFVSGGKDILEAFNEFDDLEKILDYVDDNCNQNAEIYRRHAEIEAEGIIGDHAVSAFVSLAGLGLSATGLGAIVGVPMIVIGLGIDFTLQMQRNNNIKQLRNMILLDSDCKNDKVNPKDYFGDDYDDGQKNDKGKPGEPGNESISDHPYILDPSGYVYEAVPENRIEGVTATLLEYDTNSNMWIVWDAKWYGQENPLITDAQGRYAWDVPEGDWKVIYHKDEYEPAESWSMHVPPPHLDVNIPMISYASPKVTSLTAKPGGEYIEIELDKYMKVNTFSDNTMYVAIKDQKDEQGDPVYVPGQIEPVDPKNSPDTGDLLTKKVRFVPADPFTVGVEYDVWISQLVQSYAGSIMSSDYTGSVIIPEDVVHVESVSLNKKSITLYPGDISQLIATVMPQNAHDKSVSWSSSNPGVADVDNSGLVTARAVGTATITVTTVDGGFTDTCLVNVVSRPVVDPDPEPEPEPDPGTGSTGTTPVKKPVTGVKLKIMGDGSSVMAIGEGYSIHVEIRDGSSIIAIGDGSAISANEDGSILLIAEIIPTDANNKKVTWTSSDETVAKVDNGKVFPLKDGTAIITVTTEDGNYTDTCTVIITTKPESDPNKHSSTVGANASEVSAFDDEISLSIKTAVFYSETSIEITKLLPEDTELLNKKETSGLTLISGSPVYDISLGGVTPKQPVGIEIKYGEIQDKIQLDKLSKTDPLKLGIYRWDETKSAWVWAGGAVDLHNGFVKGTISAEGKYAIMAYDKSFTDIQGHWGKKDIEILASRHVIHGINDKEYTPDRNITRAEFVKLIMSMVPSCPVVEAKKTQQSETFKDVSKDKWYFPYVEAAAEFGIVKGNNGVFNPDSLITREEMAVMIIRIFNSSQEIDKTVEKYSRGQFQETGGSLRFEDANEISHWALGAMILANQKGVIRGDANNRVKPKDPATRAEAAAVILRTMEILGLLKAPVTIKGILKEVDIEGTHYELEYSCNCADGKINYVAIPVDSIVEGHMRLFLGKEVELTGILQEGSGIYMRGPVLKVVSIGDRIITRCTSCDD